MALVVGDPKTPFLIATTPMCRGGTTPFSGFLHFTLDPYLIMLSVKQGGIKYHFWVFGMTRLRIEPRSPGPLVNTLLIRPKLILIPWKYFMAISYKLIQMFKCIWTLKYVNKLFKWIMLCSIFFFSFFPDPKMCGSIICECDIQLSECFAHNAHLYNRRMKNIDANKCWCRKIH